MKKITLFIILLTSSLLFNARAAKADDVENACGALLCLAGGAGVSECRPYLARYFAIQFSEPWKTLDARRAFLNLCPATKTDAGTASLVDSIINASRNCTAAKLNESQRTYREVSSCPVETTPKSLLYDDRYCDTRREEYIDDTYPAHCSAYITHDYVISPLIATYEGDKFNGGRWVDPAYADFTRRRMQEGRPIIQGSP